jgi:alkyl hydroperoxide reductase subunit F
MLDASLTAQLTTLLAPLQAELTLALSPSQHQKQGELRAMLDDVASTSPRVSVRESGPPSDVPAFQVLKDGTPTGVVFRGIPGGHEFSSLVLALLHADGRGKLPDEGIRARIRSLPGPLSLRTYVSLSCTNCPDVVQALNLVAILHGNVRHETVDGALAEAEVAHLGIQAVPTVMDGDDVFHVGRGSLGELLERLESRLGAPGPAAEEAAPAPAEYDVVVVGGGPAGCSAAIYSARKGLKTALVAERVGGQVRETLGIENLVSVPHTEGHQLTADLERHLRQYPVDLLEHRKVISLQDGARKEIRLKSGETLRASSVILAMGATWRELGVPGEKEYLGRGVAFCPHCDGPLFRGRKVAVVGGGNSGVEAALDLAGICAHVTVVEYQDALKADAVLVQRLGGLPNVTVVTGAKVTQVVGHETGVTGLRFQDRASGEPRELAVDGVFVQIGLVPNSSVVADLVERNAAGEIVVDVKGRTNVPGIFAAGDVTTVPYKQIIIAMGDGAKAALAAFEERVRAG